MPNFLNTEASTSFQTQHRSADQSANFLIKKSIPVPRKDEIPLAEIMLCHLNTASQLEKVHNLRDHISLPAGLRNAQFFEVEKKETNWALCLHSSFAAL